MFPRPGGIVFRRIACVLALCVSSLPADEAVQPSLTIYNQNFAVVRQELPLNLKAGPNKIQVTDITMQLEPDSVILRDPSGKHPIQVLEQNYRAFRVFAAFAQRQDGRFPGAAREQAGSRHRQNHPQRIHASQLHGYESEPFFPLDSVWRGRPARERPKAYHPLTREGSPSAAKSAKRDG